MNENYGLEVFYVGRHKALEREGNPQKNLESSRDLNPGTF